VPTTVSTSRGGPPCPPGWAGWTTEGQSARRPGSPQGRHVWTFRELQCGCVSAVVANARSLTSMPHTLAEGLSRPKATGQCPPATPQVHKPTTLWWGWCPLQQLGGPGVERAWGKRAACGAQLNVVAPQCQSLWCSGGECSRGCPRSSGRRSPHQRSRCKAQCRVGCG
jgi:hypothetical protein